MTSTVLSHRGTSLIAEPLDDAVLQRFSSNRGSKVFSLGRIEQVSVELGRPQDAFPVFHVAGTNGKGSVSCALAAMLGSNGKSAVLTISPHLERLNERVIIDGDPISDDALVGQLRILEIASRKVGVELSLHEAMTLVAFLEGARLGVSHGVLEVGLGGRLDSTNITSRSHVGIITSIALDHTDVLGDTVEAIAAEKVGILKATMKAMVVGRVPHSVLDVIDACCRTMGVPVLALGRDFRVERSSMGGALLTFRDISLQYQTPLSGEHQVGNAAVALVAALVEGLDPHLSVQGLEQAFWPGRLEKITSRQGRTIILDCAHNPAGVYEAVKFVQSELGGLVDCIFGCLCTKDWRRMVEQLLPVTRYWCLLEPSGESVVANRELAGYLSCYGINPTVSSDCSEVIQWADRPESSHGRSVPLLVLGSMYMLGAVRAALEVREKPYWLVSHSKVTS